MAYVPILSKGCRLTPVFGAAQRSISSGVFNKNGSAKTTVDERQQNIHLTSSQDYPQVAPLPLPANIDPNETVCFSPQRSRDISGSELQYHQSVSLQAAEHNYNSHIDVTSEVSADPHMACFDSRGSVNLNCMMQSNVPQPFGGTHKFTHLNMPGGQWGQNSKFMAQDLQSSHYTNLRQQVRSDWNKKGTIGQRSTFITPKRSFHCLALATPTTNPAAIVLKASLSSWLIGQPQTYSTKTPSKGHPEKDSPTTTETQSAASGPGKEGNDHEVEKDSPPSSSRASKLKQAVKEYGTTVMVFHIGISLMSLGMFYALVSSGLDVVAILEYLNLSDSALASKVGTGASTFVIAYAVHKIFAPVRISITLGATPFIVRVLRKRGILKPPKKTE